LGTYQLWITWVIRMPVEVRIRLRGRNTIHPSRMPRNIAGDTMTEPPVNR
jgi:hypothetical protein